MTTTGRKIRVLHMLPDLQLGGGQLLLLRNLSAMDRSAFAHTVCSVRSRGDMGERYRAAGIEVVSLGLGSPAGVPRAVMRLRGIIRRGGFDIVHTNNTGSDRLIGQSAALLSGRPVVNSLHSALFLGRRSRGPKEVVRRARLAVDRAIARRTVRHIIAVGHGVQEAWRGYLAPLGLGEGAMSVVHPGVELAKFEPRSEGERAALRAELGVGEASPLLVTVARLTNGKGHDLLMPVMRAVLEGRPRARLLLVGDGELRGELEAQAAREGVAHAVVFAGRRDDIPAILDASDLLVFPSLSEGFPLAVVEAMAAGRPIAAFDLPSFAELGEGRGCAVFAPIGDGGALTRLVLGLLGDPERMGRMGAAGRALVEARFTQDVAARKLEGIYRGVVGSGGSAGAAVAVGEAAGVQAAD